MNTYLKIPARIIPTNVTGDVCIQITHDDLVKCMIENLAILAIARIDREKMNNVIRHGMLPNFDLTIRKDN